MVMQDNLEENKRTCTEGTGRNKKNAYLIDDTIFNATNTITDIQNAWKTIKFNVEFECCEGRRGRT